MTPADERDAKRIVAAIATLPVGEWVDLSELSAKVGGMDGKRASNLLDELGVVARKRSKRGMKYIVTASELARLGVSSEVPSTPPPSAPTPVEKSGVEGPEAARITASATSAVPETPEQRLARIPIEQLIQVGGKSIPDGQYFEAQVEDIRKQLLSKIRIWNTATYAALQLLTPNTVSIDTSLLQEIRRRIAQLEDEDGRRCETCGKVFPFLTDYPYTDWGPRETSIMRSGPVSYVFRLCRRCYAERTLPPRERWAKARIE